MRSLMLLLALVAITLMPAWSKGIPKQAAAEIPTIEFCDLLNNPQLYHQKVIRIRAAFSRGGEDWAAIFCPACSDDKTLVWPEYEDSFETETKPGVLRKWRERFDVTLSVTLVGRFDTTGGGHMGAYPFLFHIMRAKRAERISKRGLAPWSMPDKVRKRIPC